LDEKLDLLRGRLRSLGKVMVAFSGGVDSSLLLKLARDTLGGGASGLLINSPLHPPWELEEARALAESLGVKVHEVSIDELQLEPFRGNPPDRCYHCKRARFLLALDISRRWGAILVEGSNRDDLGDYRPGLKALKELGIPSPLMEVGLGKGEVRTLARRLGLPNWDKPSSACLATRVPYGVPLDREILDRISASERSLLDLGFRGFRVRFHGDLARLEFPKDAFPAVLEKAEEIVRRVKAAGFALVCLDLEGYRASGLSFRGGDHEGKGNRGLY